MHRPATSVNYVRPAVKNEDGIYSLKLELPTRSDEESELINTDPRTISHAANKEKRTPMAIRFMEI